MMAFLVLGASMGQGVPRQRPSCCLRHCEHAPRTRLSSGVASRAFLAGAIDVDL